MHLEYFAFTHRFIVRHRVTDDLQPFSSLCPLRVLFLRFQNMTIGNYFDRIARDHIQTINNWSTADNSILIRYLRSSPFLKSWSSAQQICP